MYGLALIAVLAVMGGIIAYIGDKLGTKIGKRKLTIFGLRPKHTSILVTIVTGIVIAASTLGVLSLVSQDVRTALFGMEALKAQLTGLTQEVSAKNSELEASRAELEAKTKEYATLTAKIQETSAKLTAVTGELASVTGERDRITQALAQVQHDYTLAQTDLNKAQGEIASLQATKAELDDRVASLNESKSQLQKDIDELNQVAAVLDQNLRAVRQGNVIYQAGEVLSTTVIKGGRPPEETTATLQQILYDTNQAILNRLGITDKTQQALLIRQDNFAKKAEQITAAKEDVIVRVSAFGNSVYGERVPGWIEIFPNRLIYAADEVVYSEIVDAGATSQQAEEVVLMFLQRVNAKAVQQGVLRDPLRGSVGAMSGAQLYDVVNKVKRHNGPVELTAVTKTAIHTSGPLEIEIRVRDL
ncbi:MAG TPA: DUF3084 domain-containing protein [Selenomonadales bacterium]|nr:DUF3084 domain-containing protein [Selenomonadales bacterium]